MTEIREMGEHELEACADVIRRSFGTVAEEFGLTFENCPSNGAFIRTDRLRSDRLKGNRMFVLTDGDVVVGFMQLEKADAGTYYLEKLAVVPESRHLGYGKQLLEFTAETVRALGGGRIGIAIIEENTRLKDWYAENGYVHTGTKVFPHLPFTVGFMQLEL
jgi:ribosomal protein S18 acetylase RimI-like enzyme